MTRSHQTARMLEPGRDRSAEALAALRPLARPLASDADLDPLMRRVGDARFVLLGEASHGTSEFYTWRARITQRLIEEKGFSFVAVEGDWPDLERLDQYLMEGSGGAYRSAHDALSTFHRWPTWMWANEETAELADWIAHLNAGRVEDRRVSCYGLDVYSLWESMAAVVTYLDSVDPAAARRARRAYECFEPYRGEAEQYARASAIVPHLCQDAVVEALLAVRRSAVAQSAGRDRARTFHAEQNALVVRDAERYYRAMVLGGSRSWNVRDEHMADTLDQLMRFHGPTARGVIWAHNTHVGDARHTDMREGGEFNIGQLVRQRHGDHDTVLVGFSTNRGSVVAAEEWGAAELIMSVPPGREGSFEDLLHRIDGQDHLFLFDQASREGVLDQRRGHRAIGVVYRPEIEQYGNYVPSVLPRRYDALLYIDETTAVNSLAVRVDPPRELPETFPEGM